MMESDVVLEGPVWKRTAISDYVIQRQTTLYRDRFVTLHNHEQKTWLLEASAHIRPPNKQSIERKRRRKRPAGMFYPKQLVSSKGEPIELYTFRVDTPSGWSDSFTFGFETQDEAYKWHDAISGVLQDLRRRDGLSEENHHHHYHHRRSIPSVPTTPTASATSPATTGAAAAAGTAAGGSGSAGSSGSGGGGDSSALHLSMRGISRSTSPTDLRALREDSEATEGASGEPGGSCGEEQVDELGELWNFKLGTRSSAGRRWIPCKHSNGVAIYQHQLLADGQGEGEYMVSAVVNGTPVEVLRVLLDPASSTSMLGPASEVEVLQSERGQQVVRIRVEASGHVGQVFRPREAIVRRVLNVEEKGVYVLSFGSVDTFDAMTDLARQGVVEEAEGMPPSTRCTNPVKCRVQGSYQISRLKNAKSGQDSKETLINLVLQVDDMGGWLNHRHFLFPFINYFYGAYDAFLERMLMAVILVKDAVEQSRFAVQPASMRYGGEEDFDERGLNRLHPGADLSRGSNYYTNKVANELLRGGNRSSGGGMRWANRGAPFGSGAVVCKMSRLASLRLPAQSAEGLAKAVIIKPLGALDEIPQDDSARLLTAEEPAAAPKAVAVEAAAAAAVVPAAAVPAPKFHLDSKFYEEIHIPGRDAPFRVRGPTYMQDGKKVPAGLPMFELQGIELVKTDGPINHISRYLAVVRQSPKTFLFVFNMIVPGSPTLSVVMVWGTDQHPDSLGPPPEDPDEGDWESFDYLLWRFLNGSDEDRTSLFKMIPHIAEGSWVVKQSVGSTPCILARKLGTQFFVTSKYVEVSTDVGSSAAARHIAGMVRGATKGLVIDLGLVLEGSQPYELPEVLVGAMRVKRLDLGVAVPLDTSRELPIT